MRRQARWAAQGEAFGAPGLRYKRQDPLAAEQGHARTEATPVVPVALPGTRITFALVPTTTSRGYPFGLESREQFVGLGRRIKIGRPRREIRRLT